MQKSSLTPAVHNGKPTFLNQAISFNEELVLQNKEEMKNGSPEDLVVVHCIMISGAFSIPCKLESQLMS
ncbi:hypothetical protein POUND7_002606, partial [Theobroma cacao]